MKRIRVYTAAELQKKNPDGFKHALNEYREEVNTYILWADEIFDSLKAVFKASGIRLLDWDLDMYNYSLEFDMDNEIRKLRGQRALAWLENNLFYDLRERRPFIKRVKKYEKWYDFTRYGQIPSCPLTGVCFDEDFLESLVKNIKAGDYLEDAFNNLGSVYCKLVRNEYEYQNSEEYFLETSAANEWMFNIDGRMV